VEITVERVERVEPERLLSYRWHPYAVEPGVDYAREPATLVEFHLADVADGTRLTVVESGFDHIPLECRATALRMNEGAGPSNSPASRAMSRRSAGTADLADAAPLFAALGDETRLGLVDRLGAGGPQSITHLTSGSAVTRQAVTKHLQVLADAGLAHDSRRGRERIWALDTERLDEARRLLNEIARQWDEALERLRTFVEE